MDQQFKLTSITLHGEAGDVDPSQHEERMKTIREIANQFGPSLTYNMDETGLMYKCLPNCGYVELEKKRITRGSKTMNAKDRITLYIFMNADGSDKYPLVMIGKAKKPRCFREGKKLTYYAQKKAWSDGVTFMRWFDEFVQHIKSKTQEQVLLILNNCVPYAAQIESSEPQVRVAFLPKYTTSVFQPVDAGIIAMLKKNY